MQNMQSAGMRELELRTTALSNAYIWRRCSGRWCFGDTLINEIDVCVSDDICLEMFTHSSGGDFSLKCVSSGGAALVMGAMNPSKNEITISLPIWGHDTYHVS